MMKYTINYVINIWLTSTILAVATFFAIQYFSFLDLPVAAGDSFFGLLVFGVVVVLSLFFSAPVALCLMGYINYLSRTSLASKTKKQLLAVAAIFICTLTFTLGSVFLRDSMLLTLVVISCYMIPLVGSIFFFKHRF